MTDKAMGRLTIACREQFKAIDLHFHDLRREAGSRWMNAGVPLSVIQKWLGHGNIAQTSTYLAATAVEMPTRCGSTKKPPGAL